MLNNNTDFRYETPYTNPFEITQCYTNGTVTLQYGAEKSKCIIYHIKTCTSDTNVEDIIFGN